MYKRLHLPKTKAALAAWDALQPEWENIKTTTNNEVYALMAKETAALTALREAFFEETKDRNTKGQAVAIEPSQWLRKLVAKYGDE